MDFLVAQWTGTCLGMQRTWVQLWLRKIPHAVKQLASRTQLLSCHVPETELCNKGSHQPRGAATTTENSPCSPQPEKACKQQPVSAQPKASKQTANRAGSSYKNFRHNSLQNEEDHPQRRGAHKR